MGSHPATFPVVVDLTCATVASVHNHPSPLLHHRLALAVKIRQEMHHVKMEADLLAANM